MDETARMARGPLVLLSRSFPDPKLPRLSSVSADQDFFLTPQQRKRCRKSEPTAWEIARSCGLRRSGPPGREVLIALATSGVPPGAVEMNARIFRTLAARTRKATSTDLAATPCLDRMLIFGHRHLESVLAEYVARYNGHRPHRALGNWPRFVRQTAANQRSHPRTAHPQTWLCSA